ncbi:MAG: hypothetical protein JSU88_04060 [Nitrospinaceae bacterium]|jgi:hypothetical protein|nr:MAG: hypothetical protein JSU88_04060 [Nitrospinaceae bacterium]
MNELRPPNLLATAKTGHESLHGPFIEGIHTRIGKEIELAVVWKIGNNWNGRGVALFRAGDAFEPFSSEAALNTFFKVKYNF